MPSRADARAAAGAADEGEIARAAERIAAGGLVAFPTETVWGLAADAASASALAALARFKGRPLAQATSVLVSGPERLAALALDVDARARAWIDAFWPGPLTLVLPSRAPDALAPGIANARGEVGVRCSPHAVAAALARACEARGVRAVTATSCNAHGEPEAATRAQARDVCARAGEPALVLATGADASRAAPSTVVRSPGAAHAAEILREGAIAASALRAAALERGLDAALASPARGPAR